MVAGEVLFRYMLSEHHISGFCTVLKYSVTVGTCYYSILQNLHLSVGDVQVHLYFVLLGFSSLQDKFRGSVEILFVPLPTSYIIYYVVAG